MDRRTKWIFTALFTNAVLARGQLGVVRVGIWKVLILWKAGDPWSRTYWVSNISSAGCVAVFESLCYLQTSVTQVGACHMSIIHPSDGQDSMLPLPKHTHPLPSTLHLPPRNMHHRLIGVQSHGRIDTVQEAALPCPLADLCMQLVQWLESPKWYLPLSTVLHVNYMYCGAVESMLLAKVGQSGQS
jgi:hypothetical protein